jgi:2-iminobutanoate/2-iminopropanoate deaminase
MSRETVRTVVNSSELPSSGAPISHAVVADNLVYTSGTLGVDPKTGKLAPGGIKPETEQALRNLSVALKTSGSGLEKALKLTVYLADIKDWPAVNEIYKTFFPGSDNYPARTAFQVGKLPLDGRIEIEAVAVRGNVTRGHQSKL